MGIRLISIGCLGVIAAIAIACPEAAAQSGQTAAAGAEIPEEVVSYDAEFFVRYQPNSALAMVRRVPGFQIDDGDNKRGFGAASGNVLINDRYPSAKQDAASRILERIPASQVERIDVVRGQVRGIDLRAKSVVVSVMPDAIFSPYSRILTPANPSPHRPASAKQRGGVAVSPARAVCTPMATSHELASRRSVLTSP